ncbi:MAG TPA: hypothetical protein VLH79_08555 [Chthonomonadales bacterium]|nr:hypothetical protein [Chthonomonadales bacterium]
MKLRRFIGNPVLSPNPGNAWESLVTTNPGAWFDADEGVVWMLYRAAGDDPEHRIHLGLAASRDGLHFERCSETPVLSPSADGFDAGCVEDPRIVKIGDWYYVTYAARPFPPGRYWEAPEERAYLAPECPPEFPWTLRENATATGLGLTRDFRSWIRAGRMTSPTVDDRDVILFPEKVGGKFWLLHRPMDWVGPEYGTEHPAMWVSSSDDLLCWGESRLLAKAELPWENRKIGGNTPPLRTPGGWLTLYHAVGADGRYRLGAMLLDLEDPGQIVGRTPDWILQPEEAYEIDGYYPGVCFPCGKVVIGDTLYVYYGGADRFVGVATCALEELVDAARRG